MPLPRAKHILVVLSLYKMIYSSVDTNNAFGFNVLGPTVAAEWHYGYSAEWQIGMLSLDQIFRVQVPMLSAIHHAEASNSQTLSHSKLQGGCCIAELPDFPAETEVYLPKHRLVSLEIYQM